MAQLTRLGHAMQAGSLLLLLLFQASMNQMPFFSSVPLSLFVFLSLSLALTLSFSLFLSLMCLIVLLIRLFMRLLRSKLVFASLCYDGFI